MKVDFTSRGFKRVDLLDKYNNQFYLQESSGIVKGKSDFWIGIRTANGVETILVDDRVWKEIKKARRLIRRR